MNTKITHLVLDTLSPVTGELTVASNRPRAAVGVEIEGTGASAPTFQFTPMMRAAIWNDNGTWKDQTAALTERGTTNFAEIDSFATTADALYIGCDVPFRALFVNIKNANATASVMTVNYRKSDNTWADISATDNTASGGATLAVDDTITWSVPTDWITYNLSAASRTTTAGPLFYVQIVVSATLDTDVQVAEIIPLGVQTNRPTAKKTADVINERFWIDPDLVGGLEATGDNGDTILATWLCTGKNMTVVAE